MAPPICARCGSCTVSAPGDICSGCLDALIEETRQGAAAKPHTYTFPKCEECGAPVVAGTGNLCVDCTPFDITRLADETQRNLGLDALIKEARSSGVFTPLERGPSVAV